MYHKNNTKRTAAITNVMAGSVIEYPWANAVEKTIESINRKITKTARQIR
jgi:hypothetical protein